MVVKLFVALEDLVSNVLVTFNTLIWVSWDT